jgi:hypothetical protein
LRLIESRPQALPRAAFVWAAAASLNAKFIPLQFLQMRIIKI